MPTPEPIEQSENKSAKYLNHDVPKDISLSFSSFPFLSTVTLPNPFFLKDSQTLKYPQGSVVEKKVKDEDGVSLSSALKEGPPVVVGEAVRFSSSDLVVKDSSVTVSEVLEYLFPPSAKLVFLASYQENYPNLTRAIVDSGISRECFEVHKKADPAFAEALELIRQYKIDFVEQVNYKIASLGSAKGVSDRLAFLRNERPDKWDKNAERKGTMSTMSEETLKARAARLAQVQDAEIVNKPTSPTVNTISSHPATPQIEPQEAGSSTENQSKLDIPQKSTVNSPHDSPSSDLPRSLKHKRGPWTPSSPRIGAEPTGADA